MNRVADAFYRTTAWKKCRASFIAERRSVDGGLCQRCHDNLGYIVHHKEYITLENMDNPEITLNHDNLEYICLDCHNSEHKGHEAELLCAFDEKGRPCQFQSQ